MGQIKGILKVNGEIIALYVDVIRFYNNVVASNEDKYDIQN